MLYEEGKRTAEKYLEILRPYCLRIEIAGSIRRKVHFPKDIEIVAIPDQKKIWTFVEIVESWTAIKGRAIGKYTQRRGLHLFPAVCA